MRKLVLLTTLVILGTAIPSRAQLTVNDPANLAQAIKRLQAMEQQLVKMEQHILLLKQQLGVTFQILSTAQQQLAFANSQFALFTNESQSIKGMKTRYRYSFNNWQQFAAHDQYGNTNSWTDGVNNGTPGSITQGYRSVIPMVKPVNVTISPQAKADWEQQYALLELEDASIMSGMKAVGDIRTNMQQNTVMLAQLEADAVSTDPKLNSAKAMQQKTLVATLLLLRTQQDTNRLLAATVELQSQLAAQQRWDRGRALNMTVARTGK
jgi:hypothetical protein